MFCDGGFFSHLQLSLIPTLRNNVHTAKAYISQQDYYPAAELLGEAIEVSYIILESYVLYLGYYQACLLCTVYSCIVALVF